VNDAARLLDLRDRLPGEWAGLLTRAAQAITELEAGLTPEGSCLGCGAQLRRGGRGRPRKWCQAPECQKLSRYGGKNPGKRTMEP
jgi:hypothetical protein